MCEACQPSDDPALVVRDHAPRLDRRTLLRRSAVGSAAALAAGLWLPELVGADDPGDVFERAAMGEDRPSLAPARTIQPAAPAGRTAVGVAPAAAPRLTPATAVDAIATSRAAPGVFATAVKAPPIITRKQWGADESIRADVRQFAPIRKLIVHHTASANRPKDPASVVRFTYKYHVLGRKYGDIGYNYMIDHRGVIYEGRYSRRYGDEPITAEDSNGWGVVGAHAQRMNAGSCGVCLIGNFDIESPTDAAVASLTWLLAWKAGRHRIDMLSHDTYENIYAGFYSFENLAGHRNVGFTQCPGAKLYQRLPGIRQAAGAMAGTWDPVVLDMPALLRTEEGPGAGPAAAPATTTAGTTAPGTTAAGTSTPAGNGGSGPTTSAGTAATGSKLIGFRAMTSSGLTLNTAKATKHGNPGSAVVGLAAPGVGGGYAAVAASGKVFSFGGVASVGDAAGKGTAVDIAVTRSGLGYWVLMANGGIYPFGDARYFGSPAKAGVTAGAVRIAARPGGDGYWVLGSDNAVRGFGAAKSLGSIGLAGSAVDLAATPSGAGYLVLMDSGEVAAFGDAVAAGGMASTNARWKKPAAAIITMPGGNGYVISARDGGLYSFGGAPFLGSFAGSGATVVGAVVACA